MFEAIGMILLWGAAPCAIMVLAMVWLLRGRAPPGRTLIFLLALQFAVSAALVIAIPELVASALFPPPAAPPVPGDKLGHPMGRNMWTVGAMLAMSVGLLAALAINGWMGIARLRRGLESSRSGRLDAPK